jgi:hypothetical protein
VAVPLAFVRGRIESLVQGPPQSKPPRFPPGHHGAPKAFGFERHGEIVTDRDAQGFVYLRGSRRLRECDLEALPLAQATRGREPLVEFGEQRCALHLQSPERLSRFLDDRGWHLGAGNEARQLGAEELRRERRPRARAEFEQRAQGDTKANGLLGRAQGLGGGLDEGPPCSGFDGREARELAQPKGAHAGRAVLRAQASEAGDAPVAAQHREHSPELLPHVFTGVRVRAPRGAAPGSDRQLRLREESERVATHEQALGPIARFEPLGDALAEPGRLHRRAQLHGGDARPGFAQCPVRPPTDGLESSGSHRQEPLGAGQGLEQPRCSAECGRTDGIIVGLHRLREHRSEQPMHRGVGHLFGLSDEGCERRIADLHFVDAVGHVPTDPVLERLEVEPALERRQILAQPHGIVHLPPQVGGEYLAPFRLRRRSLVGDEQGGESFFETEELSQGGLPDAHQSRRELSVGGLLQPHLREQAFDDRREGSVAQSRVQGRQQRHDARFESRLGFAP